MKVFENWINRSASKTLVHASSDPQEALIEHIAFGMEVGASIRIMFEDGVKMSPIRCA